MKTHPFLPRCFLINTHTIEQMQKKNPKPPFLVVHAQLFRFPFKSQNPYNTHIDENTQKKNTRRGKGFPRKSAQSRHDRMHGIICAGFKLCTHACRGAALTMHSKCISIVRQFVPYFPSVRAKFDAGSSVLWGP